MIIDTHCHLDFDQFNPDREAVLERARKAGVKCIINVASSLKGSKQSIELAHKHKDVFATVGIHPHEADSVNGGVFAEIEQLSGEKKVVAIGEVGLDYFKSPSSRDRQKEVFRRFIELSKNRRLPLIIHNREAANDTLDILQGACKKPIKGVMHCFSGDRELLGKVLELGLFVSFTCNLTFKNARSLREVARHVPADRLLLETDAPFLAPQSHRGKRNEPAFITELRDMLSELFNLPKEKIAKITTENAKRLFKI